MGISQAQQMLQQLQQQMQNPNFGSNYISQLNNAGLGAQNPANFFGTPFDEQMLRQSVMGRVLGYYGMPNAMSGQYGGVGNPGAVLGGRFNIDPFTGGIQGQPEWAKGGFNSKYDWKQAGKPIGLQGGPIGSGDQPSGGLGGGGGEMQIQPYNGGSIPGGGFGGNQFYDMMQGYNPQIGALNTDYAQMIRNGFTDIANSGGGTPQGGFASIGTPEFLGGSSSGVQQGGGFGGMFPNGIPETPNNYVDQLTQGQLGQVNLDFQNSSNQLANQLFGRGMNASSAAADSAGKLLYGKQQAMNQVLGAGADRKLQLYQQMIDLNAKKQAQSGGGINFGGGGSGGGMPLNPGFGGAQMAPQDMLNILQGRMGTNSVVPLNFEQQMQLADMQLKQAQLAQQGQLGFGGLGLQQQLGLGSQGLQGQGLAQDFMSQLLGMGLSRQQGAAGMSQADLARMQQYMMGMGSQFAGIGQQNAQLEAQKQSFWKQLALAGIGGASSLLGGMASGGTGFFRP